MTDLLNRPQQERRAGLCYSYDEDWATGERLRYYAPDGVFYVDGIRYSSHEDPGPAVRRPMIQFYDDGDKDNCEVECSRPLTEAEADHYVKTGMVDGRHI